jgi:hypothetical protein
MAAGTGEAFAVVVWAKVKLENTNPAISNDLVNLFFRVFFMVFCLDFLFF